MHKHKNITFSIPSDLLLSLHSHIGHRGLSQFISEAIRKALGEEIDEKQTSLDAAYEAANTDATRLQTLRDWDLLDDTSDLTGEENWEWLKHE